MRSFLAFMFVTLISVSSTITVPGYNYQQPLPASAPIQLPRPVPAIQQQQFPFQSNVNQNSNSAIYSVVQSPPVAQFSVQGVQQSLNQAVQQHLAAPRPQQTYLPPQQQPVISLPGAGLAPVPAVGGYHIPNPATSLQQFSSNTLQQHSSQQQHIQQSIGQTQQQQFVQQQPIHPQPQLLHQPQQTAIITKDIYIHTAPEEQEEELAGIGQHLDNTPIRKNYRIVFIKAPSANLKSAAAALKRAQAHTEDKTVIYVLSKKADAAELQQQLQQVQQSVQRVNKPEVYFIKYKTQEEAQRAQQEIQAQYDALGGSTHISDEGIAPITSVSAGALKFGAAISAGSKGERHGEQILSLPILGGGGNSQQQTAGSYQYLPPKA